jgi:hypothetical protein
MLSVGPRVASLAGSVAPQLRFDNTHFEGEQSPPLVRPVLQPMKPMVVGGKT